jgi:hypothetical protein
LHSADTELGCSASARSTLSSASGSRTMSSRMLLRLFSASA